jgi:hypothetical protein
VAETVDFILRLQDQVSGAAKSAAASLGRAESAAQKAAQSLGRVQSAAYGMNKAFDESKVSAAAKAMAQRTRETDKAAASTRRMALVQMQANKMNEAKDKSKSFLGGLTAKLPFRSVADYASGAFIGEMAAGAAMGIIGAFKDGAVAAVSFLASGLKMAFVEGGKAENLRLSYKLLLGDKGGKAALDDISGFAGKTKYDDDKIAEMMRPLFNAGLKGTGAKSAFAASGDLEAAGLGSAQDFIDQFAKIQLKGGVTEKLLVGMGVNIKDFKTALAVQTGTLDKEAAFKKAEQGKSDPQAIMNAIYKVIEKRQGGKIGTGTELASKTMSARLEKFGDLPSQYLKKVSESPAWGKLSDKLGDTLAGLDPDSPRGKKIVSRLMQVFSDLATWMDRTLTPENIDKFANGAASALDALGKIPGILESVYRISRDVALVWTGVKFMSGINAFRMALGAAAGSGGAVATVEAAGTAAVAGSAAGAGGGLAGTVAALGGKAIVGTAAGALLLDGEKQGTDFDAQNEAMVKAGTRRETKHWYGSTYEDVPGAKPNVTINVGDVHMTSAPGDDPKQNAKTFFAELDKHVQRAATEGGGGL